MKKWLTAMILCVVLLCTTALAESYSATATGFGGPVTVTVGVEDGKIVSCEIDAPQETEAIGGAAAKARLLRSPKTAARSTALPARR